MKIKYLKTLSLGYLLVPNLIFFYYWTNTFIATIGIVMLLYTFYDSLKDCDFHSYEILTMKQLALLGAAAAMLTFVSGITGLAYQTFDHWCHNTKFYELFKNDWPIRIPEKGPVISYYYGYYVVPALVFKFLGDIHEIVIIVWTLLGFYIGLAWVYLVMNKKLIYTFLVICFGDTPHVIKTVAYKVTGLWYTRGDFAIESWSNFENLLWVPNQVIPTMIVAGMFIFMLKNRVKNELIVFPVVLIFWWAVFPAFAMGLFCGVVILRQWVLDGCQFNQQFMGRKVILPILAAIPVLLFLVSHKMAPISGFVWQFPYSLTGRIAEYVINIGINFIIFLLSYRYFRSKSENLLPPFPFYLLITFLLIFPVYRIGKVNDLLFRGLMPYLLMIGMYVFQSFAHRSNLQSRNVVTKSIMRFMLFLLLVLCSFISIGRVLRALKINKLTKMLLPNHIAFEPIPYDAYKNIYEVLKEKWSLREADQYLGKSDSFYELKIAPKTPINN
ncbi:hypothetical protein [Dyadobacter arcticus]|uniref:Uncharacterized protein n=1 Tax=Dyadobacter arcticus TaxID=1078754 RepID=A0ABX0UPP6_9BACT|nr:hypothetical protein [Dyadobacter arcticus]NIJ54922.1 hypothetical protein [Dyadobacter arcticus]